MMLSPSIFRWLFPVTKSVARCLSERPLPAIVRLLRGNVTPVHPAVSKRGRPFARGWRLEIHEVDFEDETIAREFASDLPPPAHFPSLPGRQRRPERTYLSPRGC